MEPHDLPGHAAARGLSRRGIASRHAAPGPAGPFAAFQILVLLSLSGGRRPPLRLRAPPGRGPRGRLCGRAVLQPRPLPGGAPRRHRHPGGRAPAAARPAGRRGPRHARRPRAGGGPRGRRSRCCSWPALPRPRARGSPWWRLGSCLPTSRRAAPVPTWPASLFAVAAGVLLAAPQLVPTLPRRAGGGTAGDGPRQHGGGAAGRDRPRLALRLAYAGPRPGPGRAAAGPDPDAGACPGRWRWPWWLACNGVAARSLRPGRCPSSST